MSFRVLDGSGDWTFGSGLSNYATESNEVALNIKTRVLSFYRDCFFDLEAGIDYFNLLDYNKQKDLEAAIQNVIMATDGVIQLTQINLYVNAQRQMTVEYSIVDVYSNTVADLINLLSEPIG